MNDLFLYQEQLDMSVRVYVLLFCFVIFVIGLIMYLIIYCVSQSVCSCLLIRFFPAEKMRYRKAIMISAYYINKLIKKSKKNMYARWRLGEILHEEYINGGKVIIHKENETIEIIKKDV